MPYTIKNLNILQYIMSGTNHNQWLNNFPAKYRTAISALDNQTHQHHKTEPAVIVNTAPIKAEPPKPHSISDNNSSQDANRNYSSRFHNDRRKASSEHHQYPREKCRRRANREKAIFRKSQLRDRHVNNYINDSHYIEDNIIEPIRLVGLEYDILINDNSMIIGCINCSINDWRELSNRRILQLGGKNAVEFWNKYRDMLLILCSTHQNDLKIATKNTKL